MKIIIQVKVNFAGLNLLPSKQDGVWIESATLKSDLLIEIQTKLLEKLADINILNSTSDRFRPHVTIGRIKESTISLKIKNESILREQNILCKLELENADEDFEFYRVER